MGPLASLTLTRRYQRSILGRGSWAFPGATVHFAAWERALAFAGGRLGANRRAAPVQGSAQLQQLVGLLGPPGTPPGPGQRQTIAAALRALDRHSDRVLRQRAFPAAERAALLELEFALHLAERCTWYCRERAPILGAPGTAAPLYVFDARCLQVPDLRRRGIGLHAREALAVLNEVARPAGKVVLLLDPEMDPVDPKVAALCDRQVYACAALDLANVVLFLSASPMTASIGPVMPLLLASHIRRVAIIYDFIPARFARSYLGNAADLIGYQARIMALPAYHAFLPISAACKAELCERVPGVDAARIVQSGVADPLYAALDAAALGDLPHRYIVAATGDDARKNLLATIAAEALNRSRGEPANRIVAVGHMNGRARAAVAKFCRRVGFTEGDLVLRSEIPTHELAAIYRQASVCAVPSFAEGFSIPVAEAVHCGTAVVASDIPAHRELIGAGPWLAAPASVADLARALRTTIEARRAVLDRQQESLGDKAKPDAVRRRIAALLTEVLTAAADAPSSERPPGAGKRLHIAVATPWPPQRSGVASYSRFTLTRLAEFADITILTNEPPDRLDAGGDRRLALREIGAAAYLDPQYACVLSVLGNSYFHLPALEYLMALGGPVLAHDNRMIEFYRHLFGPAKAARLLTVPGRPVETSDIAALLVDLDRLPALGYADIGRVAQPLIVHAESLRARLSEETQARVLALPFVPYRPPPEDTIGSDARRLARQRCGLDDASLHVATFGMLDHRTKGANVLVEALALLDARRVPARLHIIGEVPTADRSLMDQMAQRDGISDRLVFHDYLDEAGYCDMLRAVDIAVQLRTSSVLTLSGALLDCISFGLPTVATRSMASDTDAPDYVATVPDKLNALTVAEALVAHGKRRSTEPDEIERQRRAYLAQHSAEGYARAMAAALGLHGHATP